MRGVRERRGPGGALRNEAEVRVAAQVVRLLDERCPRELSMAVIAMYAEQVERLRQALGRRKFKRPVKIDTVDSFEGREEDLVVISLVRSNERGRIGFLRVPNRLNVAISRAKHLVACIGDSATLRAGEESMYGELVEAARSTGGWVSAAELVAPVKKRKGGPGPRQGIAAEAGEGGAAVAGVPGAPGTGKKRRRRGRKRRGGLGGDQAAAQLTLVGPDGEPIAGGEGGAVVLGPDGQPVEGARKKRRRRRRRRSGVAGPGVQGEVQLDGGGAEGGDSAPDGAPGEDGQPRAGGSRSRRRRRRRSGGGGGGEDGGGGEPVVAPGPGLPEGGPVGVGA
jgi:hypothetical protein